MWVLNLVCFYSRRNETFVYPPPTRLPPSNPRGTPSWVHASLSVTVSLRVAALGGCGPPRVYQNQAVDGCTWGCVRQTRV